MGRKYNPILLDITERVRSQVQHKIIVADIQKMDRQELQELQMLCGLGNEWGVIEFPKIWMPPGVCKGPGTRIIDIRYKLSLAHVSNEDAELAIATITRFVLVCFFVPMSSVRSACVQLSPTTISRSVRSVCDIAKFALESAKKDTPHLFSRLQVDDLKNILANKKLCTEVNRLIQLANRGLWSDVPAIDEIETDGYASPETHNSKVVTPSRATVQFLPFPDAFTSDIGWRSAWIVNELDATLINCLQGCRDVLAKKAKRGSALHAQESKRSFDVQAYLRNFRWSDSKGTLINELPFPLTFRGQGRRADFVWPPSTLAELKSICILAQAAHLIIFMLSTGGRISEGLSLKRGDIIKNARSVMLVTGRTYKLVFKDEGEVKEWPLPDIAIRALLHQRDLVELIGQLNLNQIQEIDADENIEKCLWGRVGSGKEFLGDYNEMLISAIESFGLKAELNGSRPHAHRFRKTVARLVALAIVGAPKILMDLFGHKSIEMTLTYILTDKAIRAEIQEVARAQVIMMAEDAIVGVEQSGGPAAPRIKDVIRNERVRLGREFGEDDLHRLAEILTFSGTYWQLVRPGVICTKLPAQSGPCTAHRGSPEPARCRTNCDHRFETAALRNDVDMALDQAVSYLDQCCRTDDPIGQEMWIGQIMMNLGRFPDLKEKWSAHPIVSELLAR